MKKARIFLINYAVLVTILVTIEIIGHFSYRVIKGKFSFQQKTDKNILFREHPYLVGTPKKDFQLVNRSGDVKISTDQNGYRITKDYIPSSETINIICIGGSTTFGTGVTDRDTWPYMLQKKLGKKYNVINLGVPGYSTLEGIIQLTTIIPGLDPDVLIIYQGWNDIRNYHRPHKSPDYFWHGMEQKNNLSINKKSSIADYSFINFLAKKIREKIIQKKKAEHHISGDNDPYIDQIYMRNLKTIQLLCEQLQVKQIYVPQVLHLETFAQTQQTSDFWTPFIKNKNMPELITKMNALMSKVIQKNNTTITIDSILTKYQWNADHFVDNGHFSGKGGEKFSDIIISHLHHLENTESNENLKIMNK